MNQDSPIDPDTVVSIKEVTVIKDGHRLIEGVNWEIKAGERWILFGANGSGKTTLMEVVSSYLFPARGSVHLFGHKLGKVDVRKLRPRIGYVGPAPTQLVRTTFPGIEIVLTGLHASFVDTRWHTYEDADWERARECLRLLHAERLADREFGTMSEGEKKRVLIARSLMASPDLLLLDEPGSGLDLGARERSGRLTGGAGSQPRVHPGGPGHPSRRGDPARLRPHHHDVGRQRGHLRSNRGSPDAGGTLPHLRHEPRSRTTRPPLARLVTRRRLTTSCQLPARTRPPRVCAWSPFAHCAERSCLAHVLHIEVARIGGWAPRLEPGALSPTQWGKGPP
jgi:iron complex transport system ATP-binding protein